MRLSWFFQISLFLSFQVSFCQTNIGNYAIGYKSVKYTDLSRSHYSVQKDLGKEDTPFEHSTITTSMWYPAGENRPDQKMNFGDFFSTTEMSDKSDYRTSDSIVSPADKFADY